MNTSPRETKGPAQPRFGRLDLAMERVRDGIQRSVDWLLGQQHEDGYWCGELEADSMLESDYIFMHTLLGTGDPGRLQRAVNEILRHQNEDGGWSLYPGGPSNLNYGVKCYLALKLMGYKADHPMMVKAREKVLEQGGVVNCNTFTKIYLCALGQYDYDAVPAVPPEIVLFPKWFYFNIYQISAWSGSAVDHLRHEAVQEAAG
jgi:squalene-hopene/tetraprenyl-beta-curcumene cyclase